MKLCLRWTPDIIAVYHIDRFAVTIAQQIQIFPLATFILIYVFYGRRAIEELVD